MNTVPESSSNASQDKGLIKIVNKFVNLLRTKKAPYDMLIGLPHADSISSSVVNLTHHKYILHLWALPGLSPLNSVKL